MAAASSALTYQQMAEALAVRHCRGILPSGHYCPERHTGPGSATPGTVHISDRADRLPFLRLAAVAFYPDLNEDVPWRREYRIWVYVYREARQLGIRIPRGRTRAAKAFVLAGVAGLSNDVPLRKEAYDWARR